MVSDLHTGGLTGLGGGWRRKAGVLLGRGLWFQSPEGGCGVCECVCLHFSQEVHLGHGCDVALVTILPLCLGPHPGAQIIILIVQTVMLRQGKVRDLPKVTQLVPSGVSRQRLPTGLLDPAPGLCALCYTAGLTWEGSALSHPERWSRPQWVSGARIWILS